MPSDRLHVMKDLGMFANSQKLKYINHELDLNGRASWSSRVHVGLLKATFAISLPINLFFLIAAAVHWRTNAVMLQGITFIVLVYGAFILWRTKDAVKVLTLTSLIFLPIFVWRTWELGGASSPTILVAAIGQILIAMILPIRRILIISSLYVICLVVFFVIDLLGYKIGAEVPENLRQFFGILNVCSIIGINSWVAFKFRYTITVLLNEMIEQRDRRTMLLRVLAHDLSSPLMTIGIGLERLKSSGSDVAKLQKAYQQIEEIVACTKSIEVASTKTNSDHTEISDLKGAINDAIEYVGSRAESKEIKINVHYPDQDLLVRMNRSCLVHQVLDNILLNAIKFSHHGGKIEVQVIDAGKFWQINIADKGIGIPADFSDRFRRMDADIRRLGTDGEKGTGFGLWIVEANLRQYGGEILFGQNDLDGWPASVGTKVTLLIPKVREV
jgi:signal transduction histidine kinase